MPLLKVSNHARQNSTYYVIQLDCIVFVFPSYLPKEGHSEVCAQQPFSSMHHLNHFRVGTVEGVIQVCQFLLCKNIKVAEIFP